MDVLLPVVPERWSTALALRLESARAHPVATFIGLEVWALFAAYRIWRTMAGPPWIWGDSHTYIAVAKGTLPSGTLLTGAMPPVVPLLWKVTRSPEAFVVVQAVLAVVAWTVLAVTLARLVRPGWRSIAAASAVLAFASTWQVVEWDWSVLSESISLSATAMICASSLWLARRFTGPRAAALALSCAVYVGARDQGIWPVALAGIGICSLGLVDLLRRRRRGALRVVLLGTALLCAAAIAEAGAFASHRDTVSVEHVFYVRIFPFASRVAWFAARGMPEAHAIDDLAASTRPTRGTSKVVGLDTSSSAWQPITRWFAQRSGILLLEYLVTHPAYDLSAPFASQELAYNNAHGNLAFYGNIANGCRQFLPFVSWLMFPPWQAEAGLAALGAVLVVRRRTWRSREVLVVGALGLGGVAAAFVAWHGDGMEVTRHTLEGEVGARPAVLVLAVLGVLA
jgi:hypothetical protein